MNSYDPLGGFNVENKENGFTRLTDVIFFIHGSVP
jgi:hypothetical protein